MKRSDKKTAAGIKIAFDGFDAAHPLPEELNRENMTAKLGDAPARDTKKGKILQWRHFVSVAAALTVTVGVTAAFVLSGGLQTAFGPLGGKPGQETAAITTAKSEKDIVNIFRKIGKDSQRNSLFYGFGISKSADAMLDGAPESATGSAQRENAADDTHGQTNVQVKGVDEPDLMKNDGRYLYSIINGEVHIYSALPADAMTLTASIKPTATQEKNEAFSSLFVKGDLLVVFGNTYTYGTYDDGAYNKPEDDTKPEETAQSGSGSSSGSSGESVEPYEVEAPATDTAQVAPDEAPYSPVYYRYYSKSQTFCTVYDISNRVAPKAVKTVILDGNFITARLIGEELYLVSSYYVDVYSNRLEDICIPMYSVDGKEQTLAAADIRITQDPEPNYLVVCGFRLDELKAAPNIKAVLGGGNEAYCTADSLFVARTVYESTGPQARSWGADIAVMGSSNYSTEIFRFAIGNGKVDFVISGKVPGQILNQFSMDEHKGFFRIATTQGDWQNSKSNVFVLNDKFETVGKIENIAPGERIFAVRFMGDTGYAVTFEQVDPLFVLDLADPRNPKIVGELKIPGFSSYLHPVSDSLLLGIGRHGNDDGLLPGLKLSLFDVSDPKNPKEIHTLIIEGDAYSEAQDNHRAFMVYPEKDLFGIPVTRYTYQQYYNEEKPEDGSASVTVDAIGGGMISSFNTYTVKNNKIVPVREYREADPVNRSAYYTSAIFRGTYINDTLYTLSGSAVTAFSMADGKTLGSVKIQQPKYNDYYGYDYGVREPAFVD